MTWRDKEYNEQNALKVTAVIEKEYMFKEGDRLA